MSYDNKKALITAVCNDYNFRCKWYTRDYTEYVMIYSISSLTFVEAASWKQNFHSIIHKYFPKAVMQHNSPYPNKIIFKIGSIVEILKE